MPWKNPSHFLLVVLTTEDDVVETSDDSSSFGSASPSETEYWKFPYLRLCLNFFSFSYRVFTIKGDVFEDLTLMSLNLFCLPLSNASEFHWTKLCFRILLSSTYPFGELNLQHVYLLDLGFVVLFSWFWLPSLNVFQVYTWFNNEFLRLLVRNIVGLVFFIIFAFERIYLPLFFA